MKPSPQTDQLRHVISQIAASPECPPREYSPEDARQVMERLRGQPQQSSPPPSDR